MPERAGYPKTSPLQIWPKGLLGLLQLKNGGEFPQRLASEALLTQLDLLEWYLESNGESFNTGNFGAALGSFGIATLSVPLGEFWYVTAFSVQSETLGAGEALQMCATIARGDGGGITMLGEPGNIAAPGDLAICRSARPFFAPPGSSLSGFGLRFTGPISVTAGIAFTRLRL